MEDKRYKVHEVITNNIVDSITHQSFTTEQIVNILNSKDKMIKALTNRVNKLSVKSDYWIKYFCKSILKYMSEEICFLTDDDEKELKEYILFLLENLEGK